MNVALEDPVICHIRFRSWLFKVGHFPVERSNLWKTHRKACGGKWYLAYFANVYLKLHMVSTLHQKQFSFINYYFSHLGYNWQWQWSNHRFFILLYNYYNKLSRESWKLEYKLLHWKSLFGQDGKISAEMMPVQHNFPPLHQLESIEAVM